MLSIRKKSARSAVLLITLDTGESLPVLVRRATWLRSTLTLLPTHHIGPIRGWSARAISANPGLSGELRPAVPVDALALALYLTTTDSRDEILDSLTQYGDSCDSRQRLYRLQWQDLLSAIEQTSPTSELESRVLTDVRAFLRARNLEYFSGMSGEDSIPSVLEADGEFLKNEPLFNLVSIPTGLDVIDERWTHGE